MTVSWTENMTTGIPELDAQHRNLIMQLNRLLEAVRSGQAQQILGELVDFLAEHAVEHFAEEEEAMAQYACPMAEVNRQEHAQFCNQLATIRSRLDMEGPSDELALLVQRYLSRWLVDHIRDVDSQLTQSVNQTERAQQVHPV